MQSCQNFFRQYLGGICVRLKIQFSQHLGSFCFAWTMRFFKNFLCENLDISPSRTMVLSVPCFHLCI